MSETLSILVSQREAASDDPEHDAARCSVCRGCAKESDWTLLGHGAGQPHPPNYRGEPYEWLHVGERGPHVSP